MDDVVLRLRQALAGRYAVDREAGRGGMAVVYVAEDLRHHRRVALKVLRPELAAALGAERFLREIAITAGLNHPHIVPLHDSGEAEGFVYYVMPFVEGESLRERLMRDGPLPVDAALRLLRDVADALACAHAHGVIHRDIKPDNVMLSGRHALVTDFGVARAAQAAGSGPLTTAGVSIGTPAYMAPEQVSADPAMDHRADLYALGILAFEMLTGRPPFEGPTLEAVVAAQLSKAVPPGLARRPDVPPALAALVARCLEKRPEDRYSSADAVLAEIEKLLVPEEVRAAQLVARRRRLAAAVAGGVLLCLVGAWAAIGVRRSRQHEWVRAEAIPRIAALADSGAYEAAWPLVRRAASLAPRDSLLAPVLARASEIVSIHTTPAGALASRRPLAGPDTAWQALGRTPLDGIRVPLGGWHLRLERPGFTTLEVLVARLRPSPLLSYALEREGGPHPGMVRVRGGTVEQLFMPGLEHLTPFALETFWIDTREITNRQYKAFVDEGGYRRREFWTEPFAAAGRAVPWRAAVARFTDRTGRPGPSTWLAGDFPEGQADFPVAGVSWFEAAAYARFAGKSLPTLYHWAVAAWPAAGPLIWRFSNFGGRGPVAVGSSRGIGPYGTFDMAGNVREWCLNASDTNRYVLGGGWNDRRYDFGYATVQTPFDRSPGNGIRLAVYREGDTTLAALSRPAGLYYPDYRRERPVGDAVFALYRRQFDYDPAPLHAEVVARDSAAADYVHETVTFDAAYGGERVIAHLLLPRQARPPYQVVVFFPGAETLHRGTFSVAASSSELDFLVKNGRAAVYPVYKSTFERGDGFVAAPPDTTADYRDHLVMWVKDFRRTVDYLLTRPDLDSTRIAYYGVSWGGYLGAVIPALEPRLKAQVLNSGGLPFRRGYPEADPLNYVSRVRIPTLLLGSDQDTYFPLKTSQWPFYRLLGTPERDKRHVVFPGRHVAPPADLMGQALAWLDRYLGPVD